MRWTNREFLGKTNRASLISVAYSEYRIFQNSILVIKSISISWNEFSIFNILNLKIFRILFKLFVYKTKIVCLKSEFCFDDLNIPRGLAGFTYREIIPSLDFKYEKYWLCLIESKRILTSVWSVS